MFDWFTPYAFHLGIFAFGSGYFYKPSYADTQLAYIKRKIVRLIIPFYLCNIFYGFAVVLLKHFGVQLGEDISFHSLVIAPLQHGHQFIYNLGTWFVIPLFVAEIANNFLTKLFCFFKEYRTIFLFLLYLSLGAISVKLSKHGLNTGWYLLLDRSLFLLPMFGFGMLYKKYRFLDSVNSWLFIFAVMLLQYAFLLYYKGPVGNNIAWMTGFKGGVLLPFLIEFLGILFWLRISALLTPITSQSKTINFIGSHTFEIMAHHLFAIMLMKIALALLATVLPLNFDFNAFSHNIWYYYCPKGIWQSHFFYMIVGVFLPLIYVLAKDKLKARFMRPVQHSAL